ncbi:hypothetical protein [Streptomyces boluensis]|uniref:Lipoprotein n=1 Tax=Streptomyces boluensis TaxID=1775135 RepID=A0A964XM69_9ACTN|nr:hypothetical protein [Streptomyces boluensis]NBE54085.1 hypothetical protein [Streptomyces boluensis]
MRRRVLFGAVGAALLATPLLTGCQDDAKAGTGGGAKPRIVKDTDDEAVVELSDGRRVSLHYEDGTGLLERHQKAKGAPWSQSRTVHATKTEPCRGIDLKARRGTVTVRAGFGPYCRDGEPPAQAVAAVGTGRFDAWDTHISRDLDGWERVGIAADGGAVTFRSASWSSTTTLPWRAGEGFGKRTTTYKKLDARFLGTWRAEDGSHRVTFRQAAPDRPATATVETVEGTRCEVHMDLTNIWKDRVQPREGTLLAGERTKHCPPEEFNSEYVVANPDGPMSLRELGGTRPLVTYRSL